MSSMETHNAIVQPCKLSADIWVGFIIVLLSVVLLRLVRCVLSSLEDGVGVGMDVEGIGEERLVICEGKTRASGRGQKREMLLTEKGVCGHGSGWVGGREVEGRGEKGAWSGRAWGLRN